MLPCCRYLFCSVFISSLYPEKKIIKYFQGSNKICKPMSFIYKSCNYEKNIFWTDFMLLISEGAASEIKIPSWTIYFIIHGSWQP